MKKETLDRLQERMGLMDAAGVQAWLLRLAREKGQLEAVFDAIREGILLLNPNQEIEYANRAAVQLLGLPADHLGGRLGRFVRGVDWEGLLPVASSNPGFVRSEIEIFYPDHRFLMLSAVPQAGDSGQPERIAVVLHDVSDMHQRAASDKEVETVRMLTLLAAGLAHELGNPLNSLSIHLQLLGRLAKRLPENDAPEAQELVEVCSGEIKRLDTLVRQFLGAIRSEHKTEFKPQILQQLLRESLEFMRTEIQQRDIQVEASWREELPSILGDAVQLKQAFFNLLKNAIQAMPQGGRLAIACTAEEEFLRVDFTDSGSGIPLENMGRLFESFETNSPGGTGLGLFIVERIVRDHGGRLGVATREGEGTMFSLWLPLPDRQARRIEMATIESPQ